MAIEQGLCASFLLECWQGVHDLANDTLKLALYTASADLSPDTTVYSTTNEVSGTGYTAGGATLSLEASTPKLIGRIPVLSFADVTFSSASFSTRGGLIYNATQANRAIAVADWGGTVERNGSDFVVTFPTVDANNAIIRAVLAA